jgi:hypothetical protein
MVPAPFGLWKSIFNSFVKPLNPKIVTGLQKAELQPVTLNETNELESRCDRHEPIRREIGSVIACAAGLPRLIGLLSS